MTLTASFSALPSAGYAYSDSIEFTNTASGGDVRYLWNFGDNTFSTDANPTHIYNFPANYTVTLTVGDSAGQIATTTSTFQVSAHLPYAIYYDQVPAPAEIGTRTAIPFGITISAGDVGDHIVELYAENSHSTPYTGPSKWNNLKPQWRFEDLNGNVISQIKTTDTTLSISGVAIGTTGYAQFYYIDDIGATGECDYNLLWATMQTSALNIPFDNELSGTPGFSNSKVYAIAPFFINGQFPDYLGITKNGKDAIEQLKWKDTKIPHVISVHSNIYNMCSGSLTSPTNSPPIIFAYPSTNVIGASTTNVIRENIPQLAVSAQTFKPSASVFAQIDDDNFLVGGFVRNTVLPTVSSLNSTISATARMQLSGFYRDTPYVWVSNPANGVINRISYQKIDAEACLANPLSSYYGFIPQASAEIIPMPILETIDEAFALSGFHGLYGTAVSPCYDVWYTDSEQDLIRKIDYRGNILRTIHLSSFGTAYLSSTPAGIAMDGVGSVWVTLFDSISVLKFDVSGNFQFATVPQNYATAQFTDPTLQPIAVDIDTSNNAFVTYGNNISSAIVKFNTSGAVVTTYGLEALSATPVDIIIDGYDDSFWVVNAHSFLDFNGQVKKYDSAGSLVSAFSGYGSPGYITIDRSRGVWFTHGVDKVTHITNNGTPSTFTVSAQNVTPARPDWFDETERIDYQALEGIATDSRDRIWVINSTENMVYVLSADATTFDQQTFTAFKITPDANTGWFNDTANSSTYTISGEWHKSAQAFGDWTGYRWIQKYAPFRPAGPMSDITIQGQSGQFDIKQRSLELRKHNESFDLGAQMKAYMIPEHLARHVNMFDNFIPMAIDSKQDLHQSFGRQMIEKIANFPANIADVDTCNVDQLYSLAEEFDVAIDEYRFQYPSEIRRLIDIISIAHNRLWGGRCKCNRNFVYDDGICGSCGDAHASNLGTEITTTTYTITAGTPFVVRDNFRNNTYELIYTGASGGSLNQYPLSAVESISWLSSAEFDKYTFFNHIPTYCNTLAEGTINWDDAYTTVVESNSAAETWFGDNGTIEEMLNYELHRGLNLIDGS